MSVRVTPGVGKIAVAERGLESNARPNKTLTRYQQSHKSQSQPHVPRHCEVRERGSLVFFPPSLCVCVSLLLLSSRRYTAERLPHALHCVYSSSTTQTERTNQSALSWYNETRQKQTTCSAKTTTEYVYVRATFSDGNATRVGGSLPA